MKRLLLSAAIAGALFLGFSVYSADDSSMSSMITVDTKDFSFTHKGDWSDLLKAGMADPSRYAALIQNPDGTARFGVMIHDFSNTKMKKVEPAQFYDHVFSDLGFDLQIDADLKPGNRTLTKDQLAKYGATDSHVRTYADPDKNYYKVTLLVKNLKVLILLETAMGGEEALVTELDAIAATFKIK